jgi:methylglutaconyl-CoA hydratase
VAERPPLRVEKDGVVATVTLDRAESRNAFDDRLAAMLREAMETLSADAGVRAVVLTGAGDFFCAGGDLTWMRASGRLPKDANFADAKGFAAAFASVDRCTKPTVARVKGAALGGGAGLVAACDVAIAAEGTTFGFPEVRLGIVPAAIAPYVVQKIGWSRARRFFLTGDRFPAAEALAMGLVHRVVPADGLDTAVAEVVASFLASGPEALAREKRLLKGMNALAPDGALLDLTARAIAEARASDEAQEGLTAFLEKRKPKWVL